MPICSGKGVLALTELDHYQTFRSQLCSQLPFLKVYYTLPNEVVGYDVACQVGKVYNSIMN